jgi:hypothetical protein
LGAAEPCSVVPARRNVRAGDDGELGGGSGISHANAAAETDGGSAGVAETLGDGRPEGAVLEGAVLEGAVLEGPVPKGAVPEGAAGQASSPDGFAADSAGSAAAVADADGGAPKLNAGESSTEDCLALLGGVSRSASAPVGRLPRDVPMLSAGSAGTASAMVSAAGRAGSFTVAADPPLVARPARVPSDAASSGGAAMAGAGLAAVGFCGDGLGGTTMPPGCASCSSPIRSSSVALDVTTVGEPPPDPSGLSVRLSKPSSL